MRPGLAQGLASASVCLCWSSPLRVTPTYSARPQSGQRYAPGPRDSESLSPGSMASLDAAPAEGTHKALPEHPDLCHQGGIVALKSLELILGPRVHGR